MPGGQIGIRQLIGDPSPDKVGTDNGRGIPCLLFTRGGQFVWFNYQVSPAPVREDGNGNVMPIPGVTRQCARAEQFGIIRVGCNTNNIHNYQVLKGQENWQNKLQDTISRVNGF
jgi:hypothetical protein